MAEFNWFNPTTWINNPTANSIKQTNIDRITNMYPNNKNNILQYLGNTKLEQRILSDDELRVADYNANLLESNKKVENLYNTIDSQYNKQEADLVKTQLGTNINQYTPQTLQTYLTERQKQISEGNLESDIGNRLQQERTRMLKQQYNPVIKTTITPSLINKTATKLNNNFEISSQINDNINKSQQTGLTNLINSLTPINELATPEKAQQSADDMTSFLKANEYWTLDHNEGEFNIWKNQYGAFKKVRPGTDPNATTTNDGYTNLYNRIVPEK